MAGRSTNVMKKKITRVWTLAVGNITRYAPRIAAIAPDAPTFGIGQPRQLFKVTSLYEGAGRAWDVDPSGKRFLVIRPFEAGPVGNQAPRPQIDIVLNWAEELKARVPVK